MLSSTNTRSSHTPSQSLTSISSPRDFDRPSSQATVKTAPSSPSPSPAPGARRPSISTTMHWLSRSTNAPPASSPPTTQYVPQRPVRISEPKLVRGMDAITQPRNGVLGAGATVVRTPDEALRDIASRSKLEGKRKKNSISRTVVASPPPDPFAASQTSPPLPPLPSLESEEEAFLSRSSSSKSSKPRTPHITSAVPVPVMGTSAAQPIPVPRSPSLRPSLKIRSVPSSEERDVVPPLPSSVPPSPPPPFKAILVSELPTYPVDPERVIVTLETCTTTYRTTLATINSRPSHLSKHLQSLLIRKRTESAASSVYSTPDDDTEDLASYRKDPASRGLPLQSSQNIHLFLDRPSAPYAHILSYLRAPLPTPENPEVIPRAVLSQSSSQGSRLDNLIELRDEAAFLNLETLHKLCVDEMIRTRLQPPRLQQHQHTRGNSSSGPSLSSIHSLRASVCTLHTLLERVETDVRSSAASLPVPELAMRSSSSNLSREASFSKDNAMSDPAPVSPAMRMPPTPPSWDGPAHRRVGSMPMQRSTMRTAPAGWI